MEEAGLKENVYPRGGLGDQSRRSLRAGLQGLRSKDKARVLAPNPTLGNGGGAVDALEWLKDRVSQHRLGSECQPQPDSGSRRQQRLSRASGDHSAGLFSKGLGSGVVAGKEQSSAVSLSLPSQSAASTFQSRNSVDRLEGGTKNQQISSGVQSGAKSRSAAATRGGIQVYEDNSVNSKSQRDSSRREVNGKSTEIKSQGTASLVAGRSAGTEIEEQSQVSLNVSSNAGVSKFEPHYDKVCVKQLSPQAFSHSVGSSGIWRESKVKGTPYKQTLHQSRSSVVDQPERNRRDGQHFSSNGQGTGMNLIDSKNGWNSVTSKDRREVVSSRDAQAEKISGGAASKVMVSERSNSDQQFSSREQALGYNLMKSEKASSLVTSHDRREVNRKVVKVSAVERKSPCAAADTVAGSASRPQINQNFSTKLEELKFRILQQTDAKSLDPHKSSNSIGMNRWSSGDEQDSLYSYALPMPEKLEVARSPSMEIFQCKGKNSEEVVSEHENDGADFLVDLPHVPREPHLRNGEQHYEMGHKIDNKARVAPFKEKTSKNGGCHSEVRVNQAFPRTGSLPPPTEAQSAVTVTAGAGSSMWSRSTAMSLNQIGDRYSPPDLQDGGTKWTSTNNMDSVGPDSALPGSEVTGASSSGSSATPCVMGNSSLDDVTQKSCGSVPSSPAVEKALSSSKLSNVHQLRRAKRPSRSLGPPLRVLRPDVESCNSRISPVCAIASVIESGSSSAVTAEEEVAKNGGQLEYPGCDPRKRKAERDLGNGDTSQILEHGSSVPASLQEKDSEGGPVQAQWQLAQEPRDMRSMPSDRPSASVSEENVGEAVEMSYDGFSVEGNKENIPVPLVPHLSSGVCSLSLGEEDVPEKDESKLLSNNSRSPNPYVAPTSQVTILKSVENCPAPPPASPPASRPEGSVISVEKRSCGVERISPCPPGNAQTNESAESVRTNSAEDSGGSARQPSRGTGKEIGEGAITTSQTKKFENSHFVWVNNERYQKLGKVGKGGSSEVFKVIDRDCNIYALKKISLKGREHRAALGFYQEIEYLEMLRGKGHVVQLIAYEVTNRAVIREDYEEEKITEDAYIYMILEFGEIDLAGILTQKRKEMADSNETLDDSWLLDFKFYWKHMLLAVKTIHDERIVHSDLKPANFLLVKGKLKLIDFGIAKAIQNDTTHIVRDSQVGTLNYMSPEAFMANSMDEEGRMVKCGRASDIWSLGCILYQMVYGHTPFSKVNSFYAKIKAITCEHHKIEFPPIPDPWLLDVMKKCLTWDRSKRPQITDLLDHPFLRPNRKPTPNLRAD